MCARFCVVVPVKGLIRAKTRLVELCPSYRVDLAVAMAADTVAAALACPLVDAVLVVTDDARAAAGVSRLGAIVVPDTPDAGLNPALRHGAGEATRRFPGRAVACLSADLPALTPDQLATALATAASYARAFVPDLAGRGTTLLTAADPDRLAPAFGTGSRDRHRASGATELRPPGAPGLRRDVDTLADLHAVRDLGVGPRTAALLRRLEPPAD